MSRRALVAALGLELEHAQLLAALVGHDARLDGDLLQAVGVEHRVIARVQQRRQHDGRALFVGQPLDEQGLPLLDVVLLATGLDDCVGHDERTF